ILRIGSWKAHSAHERRGRHGLGAFGYEFGSSRHAATPEFSANQKLAAEADYCCRFAASTCIRIWLSAARSRTWPFATTRLIFRVFRMSSSGFALSNTISATLPGSTEPRLASIPRNLAGLLVAV